MTIVSEPDLGRCVRDDCWAQVAPGSGFCPDHLEQLQAADRDGDAVDEVPA